MTSLEMVTKISENVDAFYSFVDKYSANNFDLPDSDSIILGPYSRSKAYSLHKSLEFPTKVFKFHDVVDQYYLVDLSLPNGSFVYRRLVSIRSYIKRLEKELAKL